MLKCESADDMVSLIEVPLYGEHIQLKNINIRHITLADIARCWARGLGRGSGCRRCSCGLSDLDHLGASETWIGRDRCC